MEEEKNDYLFEELQAEEDDISISDLIKQRDENVPDIYAEAERDVERAIQQSKTYKETLAKLFE